MQEWVIWTGWVDDVVAGIWLWIRLKLRCYSVSGTGERIVLQWTDYRGSPGLDGVWLCMWNENGVEIVLQGMVWVTVKDMNVWICCRCNYGNRDRRCIWNWNWNCSCRLGSCFFLKWSWITEDRGYRMQEYV